MIKELGLKDHDYYGFLGSKSLIIWYLDPLGKVGFMLTQGRFQVNIS